MGDEVRGITRRDVITWNLFRNLARGDFRHDFNERVNTRDLIMKGDENRFFEIAKRFSKKGDVWLRTNFNKYVNKTIFDILSNSFDAILPPPPITQNPDNDFYHEPELLRMVGIDFEGIKNEVKNLKIGAAIEKKFTISEVGTRDYIIRSSSYRLGLKGIDDVGYSQNRNVTKMFREVTGKEKFALIVDASGGLPLTEILNTSLDPYELGGEFFIIENIENSSDSATKLSNLKKTTDATRPPPKLSFLKDKENTVVYPLWNFPQDPKSNIYASLKIVLNRISDDEVEANIIHVDAEGNTIQTFNIGDVANSSNVKNATLAALAVFIDQGIVYESFVYTLIKRMGDWCQALSMLDLDRVYSVLNQDNQIIGDDKTLRDMLVDTEIGVVTNDRILLAFCILHGLNVFFTSAMDLARLIYFKNKNDVPSGEGLDKRSEELYASAQTLPAIPDITSDILPEFNKIITQTDLPKYILQLRNFMSNVGRLRYEFDTLTKQYNDSKQKYETSEKVERFNAANAMVSSLAKIQLDIEYNTKTLTELKAVQYPGSPRDTIRINALGKKLESGARITKSVEIVEAKEILLSVRDDLKQVVAKGIVPNVSALIRTNFIPSNPRGQGNYDEILSVMPTLTILVPAPEDEEMKGGANVDTVYDLIRKRSIRVLPNNSQEFTSTVNVYKQGSQYIDEKLNAYTVSDEYIVTEDDLQVINSFFKRPEGVDQLKALYVSIKYLLLVCDIQLNKLFTLDWEPLTKGEDPGYFEKGTIPYEELKHIWNRALQLQQAISRGNVYDGATYVYNQRLDTPLPQNYDEIQEKLNAIRTKLIEQFQLTTTPELQDSLALQTVAGRAGDLASFIREYIGQKFAKDLGLLFRNTLNMNELNRLGVIIESNLISPSVLPTTQSTELKDYVAELVGQAIFEWNPKINVNTVDKILFDVKQLITSSSGDSRRGLYTPQQVKVATRAPSREMEVDTPPQSAQMEIEPEEEDTTMSGGRRPLYEQKTRKQ